MEKQAGAVFPQRLRALREERGRTQKEFAELMNMPRTTYTGYEKEGKQPDYDVLSKIADYYGVTTDYLLGRSDVRRSSDDVLFGDSKNFLKHYDALPPEVKTIVAAIFDDFYVILSRNMIEVDEQHLAIYADLFSQIRERRSEIKKLAVKVYQNPAATSELMDMQEKLNANVSIALNQLMQADFKKLEGKKSEELSNNVAT